MRRSRFLGLLTGIQSNLIGIQSFLIRILMLICCGRGCKLGCTIHSFFPVSLYNQCTSTAAQGHCILGKRYAKGIFASLYKMRRMYLVILPKCSCKNLNKLRKHSYLLYGRYCIVCGTWVIVIT